MSGEVAQAHILVLEYLAVGKIPGKLPVPCMELTYLSIRINFNDLNENLAALCILRSSPNQCELEKLPRETHYAALDDGRKLCLECLDSAIMDTNECQPRYLDSQVFHEGLNMKVEQQVPLLLVERQPLNVAMDGERRILRRPRIGGGNRSMGMRKEPYMKGSAILILYGLPRLLTGSILAHEMMHAWLRIEGYQTLSQDVEEGICQVLTDMWLESQILSMSGSNAASTSSSLLTEGSTSPLERKLGVFFKHQIETDTSPVYGDGYRAGKQATLKYGLTNTLEHIRLTGFFFVRKCRS